MGDLELQTGKTLVTKRSSPSAASCRYRDEYREEPWDRRGPPGGGRRGGRDDMFRGPPHRGGPGHGHRDDFRGPPRGPPR